MLAFLRAQILLQKLKEKCYDDQVRRLKHCLLLETTNKMTTGKQLEAVDCF